MAKATLQEYASYFNESKKILSAYQTLLKSKNCLGLGAKLQFMDEHGNPREIELTPTLFKDFMGKVDIASKEDPNHKEYKKITEETYKDLKEVFDPKRKDNIGNAVSPVREKNKEIIRQLSNAIKEYGKRQTPPRNYSEKDLNEFAKLFDDFNASNAVSLIDHKMSGWEKADGNAYAEMASRFQNHNSTGWMKHQELHKWLYDHKVNAQEISVQIGAERVGFYDAIDRVSGSYTKNMYDLNGAQSIQANQNNQTNQAAAQQNIVSQGNNQQSQAGGSKGSKVRVGAGSAGKINSRVPYRALFGLYAQCLRLVQQRFANISSETLTRNYLIAIKEVEKNPKPKVIQNNQQQPVRQQQQQQQSVQPQQNQGTPSPQQQQPAQSKQQTKTAPAQQKAANSKGSAISDFNKRWTDREQER